MKLLKCLRDLGLIFVFSSAAYGANCSDEAKEAALSNFSMRFPDAREKCKVQDVCERRYSWAQDQGQCKPGYRMIELTCHEYQDPWRFTAWLIKLSEKCEVGSIGLWHAHSKLLEVEPAAATAQEDALELSDHEWPKTHTANCGHGESGWWVELSVADATSFYYSGWINTANGSYQGCGTCQQCRDAVARITTDILDDRKKQCVRKGGTEHSASRGQRVEKIEPTKWEIHQEGIYSKCKKWVSC